jgi:hypothetical protein
MKIKKVALVGFFFSAALVGVIAASGAAAKATDETPVVSCPGVSGWRVNADDELGLKPLLDSDGAQFTLAHNNGKGLLKRDIADVKIAELPALTFEVTVHTGVAPLIKAETKLPYSTINFMADGKLWSSKIAAGPGSQDAPVADRGTLTALAPYTENTRVVTVGFGYANDTGNEATVKSFTYGETKYSLQCKAPEETPTANPTTAPPTDEPTDEPTGGPGPGARPTLPKTGPSGALFLGVGLIAVAGGSILYVVARPKRKLR